VHPVEADGCGVVVLRERKGPSYEAIERGVLYYDGERLWLEHADGSRRELPEDEWPNILNVTPSNKIPQCAGFDFFMVNP
jgi:hypothetical protein